MVTFQSVQGHTGLTHPFNFSGLSARVPKWKNWKGWIRSVWHWTLWYTHFCHNQKSVGL